MLDTTAKRQTEICLFFCFRKKKGRKNILELFRRLGKDTKTRNKLLITFGILFGLLIGYRIPIPGVDTSYMTTIFQMFEGSGVGGFFNSMTGGSFEQMSIFALSVSPYISASIVLQLATIAFPRLEEIQKDGSVGHQKMERLTYVIAGLLSFILALAMSLKFGRDGLFLNYTWYMVVFATLVWTAGACFLVWIGQTITNKLVGNGISMILLFNILSTMPQDVRTVATTLSSDKEIAAKIAIIATVVIVILLLFAYVIVLESTEKRISIKNSHKVAGQMTGANNNVLPIKLNAGGVMPIIYSSTIMSIPVMAANFFKMDTEKVLYKVLMAFNQSSWFNPETPWYTLGVLAYIPLTFFMAWFASLKSFNAKDVADNLRKNGSVINGIRPGQPTAEYLEKHSRRILIIGTTMLIFVALLPTFISNIFSIGGLSFGGTSIIIIVGVLIELRNTLNAQTSSVAYKTLIKKRKGGRK